MAAKIFSLVPHNLSFFLLATISLVPKPEIKNGKKPKGGMSSLTDDDPTVNV
jgi:hypothetical protein